MDNVSHRWARAFASSCRSSGINPSHWQLTMSPLPTQTKPIASRSDAIKDLIKSLPANEPKQIARNEETLSRFPRTTTVNVAHRKRHSCSVCLKARTRIAYGYQPWKPFRFCRLKRRFKQIVIEPEYCELNQPEYWEVEAGMVKRWPVAWFGKF